jgi:hypothetical protein
MAGSGSLPDQMTVSIHFPDAVKRNRDMFTLCVSETKREMIAFLKEHLFQGYLNDPVLPMVIISDFEAAPPELLVPADPVQKIFKRLRRTPRNASYC